MRRVYWLDRGRRPVAILVALTLGPLLTMKFGDAMGPDWPSAHVWMLGLVLTPFIWLVTEITLAGIAALWDAEAAELASKRGVPAARALRKHALLARLFPSKFKDGGTS